MRRFLDGIGGFFKNIANESGTKHILVAVSLLVLVAIGVRSSAQWASGKAQDLLQNLRHGDVLKTASGGVSPPASGAGTSPTDVSKLPFSGALRATPEEKARLTDQLDEARKRASFHLQATVFIFANYYSSIVIVCVSGAVAAVALVLISKKGWNDANAYIINVFFVMTAVTVFFGAFPALFRQQQGVDDNKQLYLKYVALEDEILSYAATGLAPQREEPRANGPEGGNTLVPGTATGGAGLEGSAPEGLCDAKTYLEPRCFILHVDRELARGGIPIGLDSSKIPSWTNTFDFKASPGGG